MNNHVNIQKRLAAYCSGDLDSAERAEIDKHLATCTICRIHVAEIRTTLKLLKSTPETEPPPWLKSRIMARLREQEVTRQSWWQRIWFPLHSGMPAKVLALVVVCISGYYLSRSVDTELWKARQQQDIPAAPAEPQPPPQPSSEPAEKNVRSAPHPAVPRSEIPVQPSTAPPSSAPAAAPAPTPVPATPAAPPQPYAPAPPETRVQSSGKSEMYKSVPAAESLNRAEETPSEMKQKARRSLESSAPAAADHAAGVPAARAVTAAALRLHVADPERAQQPIRDAITRSGGTITHDRTPRQITLRIPSRSARELYERLESVGHITERPSLTSSGQELLLTITW